MVVDELGGEGGLPVNVNDPHTYLDQLVQRLQNLPSFHIYAIDNSGKLQRWYDVPVGDCVAELSVRRDTVPTQVETIAAQVGHWGRLSALAKRAWQIREREYRVWRDRTLLAILTPPDDGEEKQGWSRTAKGEPKAPSLTMADQIMRQSPEYGEFQQSLEEAEEAYNAANAMLDAFRAKANVLRHFVRHDNLSHMPQLSI